MKAFKLVEKKMIEAIWEKKIKKQMARWVRSSRVVMVGNKKNAVELRSDTAAIVNMLFFIVATTPPYV